MKFHMSFTKFPLQMPYNYNNIYKTLKVLTIYYAILEYIYVGLQDN